MPFELTLTGHLTPADKARDDYAYVAFTLPAAATHLELSYSYSAAMSADKITGGNVIDIGLFDPRGSEFPGGVGFRGWSGSARQQFYITHDQATPGYLPGPLPAGTYQLILGLYRIQPAGADYTITVSAELQEPAAAVHSHDAAGDHRNNSVAPPNAASSARFWLRGDLQSHTEHSDARGTIAQLTAKARALGLDFLAITDHNTVSHHAHLAKYADNDLLLITGQEATTYYGHMNIWGTSRWCDFRSRTSADMAKVIALAHAGGALCSINHPKMGGPAWEYPLDLPVDAIEVWQGPWPHANTESLALWERLLLTGRHMTGVGGSDYHCPAGEEQGFLRLGQPTTWLKVRERSVPAILDAIRAGHVSLSYMADGPRLDLRASAGGVNAGMGDTLSAAADTPITIEVDVERGAGWLLQLIVDGLIALQTPVSEELITVRSVQHAARFIRAELVGDAPAALVPSNAPAGLDRRAWRWALTNPIYVAPAMT